jgi:leader peptidase (prepilin peptidase)/N-methyltransferase
MYFLTFKFLAIPVFVFGSMVGSFLNVFLLRGGTGKWKSGRSVCFSCGKTIEPIDMVPILSYLFLKGRCRFCKSKISSQYPLVEFLNGVLFLVIFYFFFNFGNLDILNVISVLNLWGIVSMLVLICFYDIKHKIIPTGPQTLLYIFTFLKILLDYFSKNVDLKDSFWTFGAGFLASLPFFLLWVFSKGRWIGFGDVKLAIPLGWLVGIGFIIQSIMMGYIAGGLLIVLFWVTKKISPRLLKFIGFEKVNLGRKTEVPFAPFLIMGFLIMFLFPSVTYYLFPFLIEYR